MSKSGRCWPEVSREWEQWRQEAYERAFKEGFERGYRKRLERRRAALIRLLERRFGPLSQEVRQCIDSLYAEAIANMGVAMDKALVCKPEIDQVRFDVRNAMDRLSPDLAEVVAELRSGLKELYGTRFRDLLLYGSYARGGQWEGSDVHLLVLLDGPVDTGWEILRLESLVWPLSLEHGLLLSVLPVSHEAYQKGQMPFLRIIQKDAVQVS